MTNITWRYQLVNHKPFISYYYLAVLDYCNKSMIVKLSGASEKKKIY